LEGINIALSQLSGMSLGWMCTKVSKDFISRFNTIHGNLNSKYLPFDMVVTLTGTVEYLATYDTQYAFPVSAGIGQFNASQATNFRPSYLAFWFSAISFNFWFDSTSSFTFQPPICYGTPCSSFYVTGGLAFVTPDPFETPSLYPDSDIVIVRNTQGLLFSFWEPTSAEASDIDGIQCSTFGFASEAFQICLVHSALNANHTLAGCSYS
jgi:hypothetical protein